MSGLDDLADRANCVGAGCLYTAGQFSTVSTTACADWLSTCSNAGEGLSGGSTSEDKTCEACPAGQYAAMSDNVCITCAAGSVTDTVALDGGTTCTECPYQKYTTDPSIQSCINCPAGKYVNVRGSNEEGDCIACRNGKYLDQEATLCVDDDGVPVTDTNRDPLSRTDCDGGNKNWKVLCITCPVGKFSSAVVGDVHEPRNQAGTHCSNCKDVHDEELTGYWVPPLDGDILGACAPCPIGKYGLNNKSCHVQGPELELLDPELPPSMQDDDPETPLLRLLEGRGRRINRFINDYTNNPSSNVGHSCDETSCDLDSEDNICKFNGSQCFDCGPGEYTPEYGQSRCTLCEGGKYSPGIGEDCPVAVTQA